jgi:hypothetical protein
MVDTPAKRKRLTYSVQRSGIELVTFAEVVDLNYPCCHVSQAKKEVKAD